MSKKSFIKFLVRCFASAVIACLIIISPVFFTCFDTKGDSYIPGSNVSTLSEKNAKAETSNKDNKKDDIAVFSSETCFKKTYYVAKDGVKMFSNIDNASSDITLLNKDDELICDKEKDGYLYCESNHIDSKGNLINGWVKENNQDLNGMFFKRARLIVDINLTSQTLNMYKDNILINNNPIKCSSGIKGNNDTETPLGFFTVKDKFENLTSKKYNENVKYAVKFLGNYLIHSVPIDETKKNGKIEYEEEKKAKDDLGKAASHGCIRISVDDAKKVYNTVSRGDLIYIHY
ncbi:L,D-transpeptidase [Clostridium guangxiense]|uniref:L,D-transpeptidase n=1 Tax=Clostridium guangxiense TaxID=1662055 RepID=UPI001E5626C7|nr:L,D-transpeptidase [Clostridium guangxiense]MCD2348953.1 L,D-transpeptidase [Clostridium guangxiense]